MECFLVVDELFFGNSELLILEGFVYMMCVVVDLGSRGVEYFGWFIGVF